MAWNLYYCQSLCYDKKLPRKCRFYVFFDIFKNFIPQNDKIKRKKECKILAEFTESIYKYGNCIKYVYFTKLFKQKNKLVCTFFAYKKILMLEGSNFENNHISVETSKILDLWLNYMPA